MGIILKVENINVYYGNIHAIKDVSFEVNEGEIVTLIGANGAGKSSSLNTITGLLRSRTGSIEFDGENISHTPAHKIVSKGLALVPEGRRIFQQMTVKENLDMGAYTGRDGFDDRLAEVYERFPRLKEREKQIAGTLSGGEQQMLAMGRALMSSPKLLMLDEPSMGLAPILVEQIFDIISSLHKAGTTILLVEQNAQAALAVAKGECDRGISVDGVGYGSAMIANKINGIYAAVCQDPLCAALSRQHNDTNVLCLGAKIIGTLISSEIVKTWMTTDAFTAEKYVNRVNKVKEINDRHCVPVK